MQFLRFYSLILLVLTSANAAGAQQHSPLELARDGKTNYQIVIGKDAHYGEQLAAKELALFLNQITGAEYPISQDDKPEQNFEIVLGNTTRKKLQAIPEELITGKDSRFSRRARNSTSWAISPVARCTVSMIFLIWNSV